LFHFFKVTANTGTFSGNDNTHEHRLSNFFFILLHLHCFSSLSEPTVSNNMIAPGQKDLLCNYIKFAFIASCTPSKIEVETQQRGREIY